MLLVVDDEPAARRTLVRLLRKADPEQQVHAVASAREAEELAARHRDWKGFVVDYRLGDGDGITLLARLVGAHPGTLALLVTGSVESSVANDAYVRGFGVLRKPFGVDEVAAFLRRALPGELGLTPQVMSVIGEFQRRYALSPRLVELLTLAVSFEPRDALAGRMGITDATYKSYVRDLLARCDARKLDELVADVLREAT